jgi:ribulose-phosphate 3-epimerase
MVQIIPAILTNDIREIEEKLKRAEGIVERVQIDIIDGQFVENRTIDPSALEKIETDLDLDFHLMTKEPIDWVERAVRGGADRVIGQIEQMSDQLAFVGKVQEVGLSVGLAIDLETPVSAFDPTILNNLDVVLIMAVKAGFGGQEFNLKALEKIKKLDEIRVRDDSPFRICVDGGETLETIDDTHLAGADEVVVGKSLFKGDLAVNIRNFVKAAHER